MALFRRIKQLDIKILTNQFLRSYFQIRSPCRAECLYTKSSVVNYQRLPIQKCQFELPSNVRFFAAPVQAKPKKEEKDTGARLNEAITADIVRLVTEEGHSVVPKQEALKRARSLKLDLVEVHRHAKPPVCKIMDYHKEKYQQEVKEKDRAKSKSEASLRKGACKEVRFSGNITQRDLQIKVDMIKRLIERGYRVKCQANGNKNKDGEGEDSATLLSRICALIEDISIVESDTRVEDKDQAHIIVRHIKYGPTKKGSVKKGSTGNKCDQSDNDVLSEENADEGFEKKESGWKLDKANDDFDKIFELGGPDVAMNLRNERQASSSSGVSSRCSSPFPGLDSASSAATSSPSVAGTVNRYMKDPKNSSHHRSPRDASGYGERNNFQFRPQFSGSGSPQHLNVNFPPRHRETEYNENQSSSFPKKNRPEQAPFTVPSSPPPSYGVFREVDNASRKQSLPAESNRYKQGNSSGNGGRTGRRAAATATPRF